MRSTDNTGVALLVGGLAVAGFVIATSFTAASYWPGSTLARLVPPAWCGLPPQRASVRAGDPGLDPSQPGCGTVIETPGARIFGLPNSLLGMAYYSATIALALLGLPPALRAWHLAAAWFAVAFGVYLGYRLLRVERMSCPLCWTSHALNMLLAIALSAAWRNPP